jgi:3-hydroxyacyl-[acyl-carrier-protein] dehydratase
MLDHHQIRAILPQRWPMLLLDRVLAAEPGVSMTAVKAVSATEPCYRDLPDDAPPPAWAYPLSLLIESFGQAAAVLWVLRHRELDDPGALPLLAGIKGVRVSGRAYPGDVLRHEVRLEHAVDGAAFATGECSVAGRCIATFDSLLAVVRPGASLRPTDPAVPATR